jgi:hypothetical protein
MDTPINEITSIQEKIKKETQNVLEGSSINSHNILSVVLKVMKITEDIFSKENIDKSGATKKQLVFDVINDLLGSKNTDIVVIDSIYTSNILLDIFDSFVEEIMIASQNKSPFNIKRTTSKICGLIKKKQK